MSQNALSTPFGAAPTGETVDKLTLDNGIIACDVLTFGGIIQSLRVPDRRGGQLDVVLGCDTMEEYLDQNAYLGAMVGRVINRIDAGRFTLNGVEYRLAVNDGPNHIHGGRVGFSHRVWTVEEHTPVRLVLTLDSPDGEENYPGHLSVRVTYELAGGALTLRFQAQSDKDTPCNLSNHSYFNLSGHDSGTVLDQEICINGSAYTLANAVSIPTGEIAAVDGTPMDLRRPTRIGAHIDDAFQQLRWAGGYDHNWVVDGPAGTLRPAAWAKSPASGVTLAVDTTMPGVQLYTANSLRSGQPGKGGAVYGPRHAFCLETQFFPDSPNHSNFPSCVLRAGEAYDHTTRFAFGVE